jgi:cellulose biosynthesis protein BcsQ
MHLKSYDSEVNIMKVTAVVSTKGGPGKTTVGVNLGAFCADAGIRTLLIDLDNQPSLSSFYALSHVQVDTASRQLAFGSRITQSPGGGAFQQTTGK